MFTDRKGHRRKGFFGKTTHHDADGNKLGERVPNVWGASTTMRQAEKSRNKPEKYLGVAAITTALTMKIKGRIARYGYSTV